MASSVLESINEEVTCPICQQLMTEPVSADCGHTFCKPCITARHEATQHEQGESHCPVCRDVYQFENLRPSYLVVNMVEKLRELTLSTKADHCDLHGEKLLLFCKDDGKVICCLCEHSQQHHDHKVVLMEEAVEEYQEKLHQVLEKLTKDEKECEKWKTHIKQERTSWKDVKDFVERNKLLTVQQPRTFPKEKRIVFKSPDLRGILQSHQAPGIPAPSNSPNVVLSAPSRPTAVTNYPSEYSLGGATATNPVTTSVIPTGSWIR